MSRLKRELPFGGDPKPSHFDKILGAITAAQAFDYVLGRNPDFDISLEMFDDLTGRQILELKAEEVWRRNLNSELHGQFFSAFEILKRKSSIIFDDYWEKYTMITMYHGLIRWNARIEEIPDLEDVKKNLRKLRKIALELRLVFQEMHDTEINIIKQMREQQLRDHFLYGAKSQREYEKIFENDILPNLPDAYKLRETLQEWVCLINTTERDINSWTFRSAHFFKYDAVWKMCNLWFEITKNIPTFSNKVDDGRSKLTSFQNFVSVLFNMELTENVWLIRKTVEAFRYFTTAELRAEGE